MRAYAVAMIQLMVDQPLLLLFAVLALGFAVGRVYSIVVDGRPTPLFLGVLAAEICFALLAAASLRHEARAG